MHTSKKVMQLIHNQVAQLWQGDCATSAILSGWVTLKLNFRLKGHVLCQYLWII